MILTIIFPFFQIVFWEAAFIPGSPLPDGEWLLSGLWPRQHHEVQPNIPGNNVSLFLGWYFVWKAHIFQNPVRASTLSGSFPGKPYSFLYSRVWTDQVLQLRDREGPSLGKWMQSLPDSTTANTNEGHWPSSRGPLPANPPPAPSLSVTQKTPLCRRMLGLQPLWMGLTSGKGAPGVRGRPIA